MTRATENAGRADYFGQAVNRAARLREAAGPGQASACPGSVRHADPSAHAFL